MIQTGLQQKKLQEMRQDLKSLEMMSDYLMNEWKPGVQTNSRRFARDMASAEKSYVVKSA